MSTAAAQEKGALAVGAGSPRAWVLATRPHTLPVGVVPVVLGAVAALRLGTVRMGAVLAALAGAMLIQIGTNLANDVFDHEKGADTPDRIGPTRVTQAGLLTARQVRTAMVASFGLAVAVGVYLTWVAGPIIVAIGIASIAAGIAYTGGPYPLGYHGLGDIFVLAFFGPVAVCGTAFVACGRVDAFAVVAGIATGSLATAVLVVNNVRDVNTDRVANKRTLAVRWGRAFGVAEYACLLAAAEILPVALVLAGLAHPAAAATLVTVPWAVKLVGTLRSSSDGPTLNRCLANTARLLLVHGIIFAVGSAWPSLAGR